VEHKKQEIKTLVKMERLTVQGIHDVFDQEMENSYEVKEGECIIGYLCFHENEKGVVWMDFILAKERGDGDGEKMIEALFERGIEQIEGTSIYGPHFFWMKCGAKFLDEVEEYSYDGIFFTLSKADFYGRQNS